LRVAMITPFKIQVDEEKLSELRRRLQNTRWPYQIPDSDWRSGTDVEYLKELVQYWLDGFDWREQEASLNRFAQFTTDVEGTTIHFVHERGNGPKPFPLILTHGWPDSFYRFYKLIPRLTDPAAFGIATDWLSVCGSKKLVSPHFLNRSDSGGGAFRWIVGLGKNCG